MKGLVLISLLLISTVTLYGKDNYVLSFYNVENMFDTIPSLKHNDKDFTPEGKFKWDTQKYRTKINNISKAIDQIAADVIALAEIESEEVIRDLVINLKTDYNYLVLDNGDKRGINMALLYKGDKFIPESYHRLDSGTARGFALVKGKLGLSPINIIIVHMASNFNSNKYRERNFYALNQFAKKFKDEQTIIMGDFNACATDKIFKEYMPQTYLNPFREFALKSQGSCTYKGVWLMYDNMLLSENFTTDSPLKFKDKGILINQDLLDKNTGYPLRTFSAGSYLEGYSDHLPIWLLLER